MSARRFEGRAVLITGAAGGIGARAAEALAAEGARLVLGDRDGAGLAGLRDRLAGTGAAVEILTGDVAREETHRDLVACALDRFGRLDVAVNNAGVVHPFAKLVDLEPAELERMFAVNVMGVFLGLRAQIPVMERLHAETGRTGAIVAVASVAGVVGAPLLSAYAAAKHAVIGLVRSAAAETARRGVRINALCPSFTETAMVAGLAAGMAGPPEEAIGRIVGAVPMRRLARPDEVVAGLLHLADPANSFMTGQTLVLDGGLAAI